jgi:hypothetical protein
MSDPDKNRQLKEKMYQALFMDELLRTPEEKRSAEKTNDRDYKVVKGMADIPVGKMLNQAQFIQENLLPRLKKKGGDTTPDYLFFVDVYKSLLWSILVVDRLDIVKGELSKYKTYNVLFREHIQLLEAELQKYTTMEDIYLTDALDRYAQGVKSRVEALLRKEKG